MVVAQPPVSVAGGGDLPMRKKIDILENCCSRPIVKKKNSYIVIPTFSWACLSWRLSQQNRWWPRVIAVRAQQKGVGGFGREERDRIGWNHFRMEHSYSYFYVLMRFIAVFSFKVSSLIQQEMALMLRTCIFLANDTRHQWYYFSLEFCIDINFKQITYDQGESQSTFIKFSHDF